MGFWEMLFWFVQSCIAVFPLGSNCRQELFDQLCEHMRAGLWQGVCLLEDKPLVVQETCEEDRPSDAGLDDQISWLIIKESNTPWIIASKTCTKLVVEEFELLMGEGNPNYLFSQYKTPMDKDYCPELDDSPFLNAEYHYNAGRMYICLMSLVVAL